MATVVVDQSDSQGAEPLKGASTSAALLLRNVELVYGDVRAVDGISLEVRQGEFFTLLGPSGSGKTTTLHVIAGFLTPTAGEICLDGIPITHVPPFKRNIGVVFQSYALFPHMTVFENIAFPLRIRKTPREEIRVRVEEVLELVKLSGYGSRKIGQLSGGQQQRVAMARAIVFSPRLLLMDEPLGALDAQLRKQMQTELKRLQERLGITVVYVTHDQEEALVLSDRIAVIRAGRVMQIGRPEEIYERPSNRFVAEFIGDTNVITARVERCTGGLASVVTCAYRFLVPSSDDLQPGQAVGVAVRPEHIVIEPNHKTMNAIEGVVRETFYTGNYTVVIVEAEGGLRLTVKEPNSGRRTRRRKGDSVAIGWVPEHATLLVH